MDKLSTKEMTSMMILYMLGTAIMTGYTFYTTPHPLYIIISFLSALIPIVTCTIIIKNNKKNLFSVIDESFNKFFSKIINLFFVIYAFIIELFYLRYFIIFTKNNILIKTPVIITTIIFLLLIFLTLKRNIITLGKLSTFLIPINILIILFGILFSVKMFDINNLNSLLTLNMDNIYDNLLLSIILPFSDIVLFGFIINNINKNENIKKSYSIAFIVSFILIMLMYFTNIFVLGFPLLLKVPYPTFITVGLSSIGTYVTRMEIIVAFNFFISTLVKISVCSFAAMLGLKHIMDLDNIKDINIIYTIIVFITVMIMPSTINKLLLLLFKFKWYFLFTAFILPILVLIRSKIKNRKKTI